MAPRSSLIYHFPSSVFGISGSPPWSYQGKWLMWQWRPMSVSFVGSMADVYDEAFCIGCLMFCLNQRLTLSLACQWACTFGLSAAFSPLFYAAAQGCVLIYSHHAGNLERRIWKSKKQDERTNIFNLSCFENYKPPQRALNSTLGSRTIYIIWDIFITT